VDARGVTTLRPELRSRTGGGPHEGSVLADAGGARLWTARLLEPLRDLVEAEAVDPMG